MDIISLLITSILPIIFFSGTSPIKAQQPYQGDPTTLSCDDSSSGGNSNSEFGYTCNGLKKCQAFLTFRSQSMYNNVSSISALFGTHPSNISKLNSVPEDATFPINQVVLIPVTCSCSGQYYQSNTSFVVQNTNDYSTIASNTFESLTTCQALKDQNNNKAISSGTGLVVPLRCACPTPNQNGSGVNYLLSYLVTSGQTVSIISSMFGVNTESTLQANSLSDTPNIIYPFTTLLVPLQTTPSSSKVLAPPPPPPPPLPSSNKDSLKIG